MFANHARLPRLFFNPFRNRYLGIVSGAHLLLSIGLGRVSFFAPDEGGYLQTFQKTYRSDFNTSSVLGWSNSETNFLRIVYAPAKILTSFGVPDFLSIRVLAVLTSVLAIYLLMCVYQYEPRTHLPFIAKFFLFTPSLFLWMSLGLRESFIYLALSMICFGIVGIHRARVQMGFIFLALGNLLLFETKSYLFLLVAFALFVQLIFGIVTSKKLDLVQGLVVLAVLLPIVLNPAGDRYLISSIDGTFTSVSSTGQVGLATVSKAQAHVASESTASTMSGLCQTISSRPDGRLSKIFKFLGFASKCTAIGGGSSGYRTSRLNITPAQFGDPLSIVHRTLGFLFTPFPFIDNGSLFLNVAALESPFWWMLYGAVGLFLYRRLREKNFNSIMVFCVTFSAVFILFSAFTEINVGTLLRHRSVMGFPLLYLLALESRVKVKNNENSEVS